MLLSILAHCPLHAKPGLQHADEELVKAANAAGAASQKQSHTYFTFNKLGDPKSDITLAPLMVAGITQAINSVNGALKGPAQNARAEIDQYVRLAIREQYKLDDVNVQKAMAYFLLAVATEGFVETDTTGTQMGNFLGQWRGGGFA